MYGQNFVVPRKPGHNPNDNQALYDTWKNSIEVKNLEYIIQQSWGKFLKTGEFSGELADLNSLELPNVNLITEELPYKVQETFKEECAVLDEVLNLSYLDRKWDKIGENFE